MRKRLLCATLTAAALVSSSSAGDAQPVDLQLVLAIDSSSSVSMDEYYLQLEGYAAAFSHPDLLRAIRSGSQQAIAVSLVEWSGDESQVINFPWRRLDSEASLVQFASELEVAPRLVVGGETAIGEAIDFAAALFERSGFEGGRRVIDISGDGTNNRGRSVAAARDRAVANGITVNGLAILAEEPALDVYYRTFVIGGDGAFVIAARDYSDFAEAILKKLVREIINIAAAETPSQSPVPDGTSLSRKTSHGN
jgi:hypothetical protein